MHVGFIMLLALLLLVSTASATLVTQDFYVEIVEANPEITSVWPYVAVGDKFFGKIGYDDANIAATGAYNIGYGTEQGFQQWLGPTVEADEYQLWSMVLDDPIFGVTDSLHLFDRRMATYGYPLINFMDGKLNGIDLYIHTDLSAIEDTVFIDDTYHVWGGTYIGDDIPFDYDIVGKLVVPEPATMLLLVSGLFGLRVIRKRYRN